LESASESDDFVVIDSDDKPLNTYLSSYPGAVSDLAGCLSQLLDAPDTALHHDIGEQRCELLRFALGSLQRDEHPSLVRVACDALANSRAIRRLFRLTLHVASFCNTRRQLFLTETLLRVNDMKAVPGDGGNMMHVLFSLMRRDHPQDIVELVRLAAVGQAAVQHAESVLFGHVLWGHIGHTEHDVANAASPRFCTLARRHVTEYREWLQKREVEKASCLAAVQRLSLVFPVASKDGKVDSLQLLVQALSLFAKAGQDVVWTSCLDPAQQLDALGLPARVVGVPDDPKWNRPINPHTARTTLTPPRVWAIAAAGSELETRLRDRPIVTALTQLAAMLSTLVPTTPEDPAVLATVARALTDPEGIMYDQFGTTVRIRGHYYITQRDTDDTADPHEHRLWAGMYFG